MWPGTWLGGVGILIVLAVSLLFAQGAGPQTQDERARLVKSASNLERDPLAKEAPELRKWALTWLIDHPELDFNVCTSFLAPLLKSTHRYSAEINQQMVISSGAFVIEHPDQMHANDAVYLAGLQGSLAVYESILGSVPEARLHFLDDLVERRNKGKLPAYIASEKKGCK